MTLEIFTTGYPRSGNTWLGQLLSDLLDAPLQTQPGAVTECFGRRCDGPYVVRKTHRQAHEWAGKGFAGPARIVLIARDPRDVAVSAMYYRQCEPDLMGVLRQMCEPGAVDSKIPMGVYHLWMEGWLASGAYDAFIRYRDLHERPVQALHQVVLQAAEIDLDESRIQESYERQRFARLAPRYPHSMRKGVVGDWRAHFNRAAGDYLTACLGDYMLKMDYIHDLDWWKELPA